MEQRDAFRPEPRLVTNQYPLARPAAHSGPRAGLSVPPSFVGNHGPVMNNRNGINQPVMCVSSGLGWGTTQPGTGADSSHRSMVSNSSLLGIDNSGPTTSELDEDDKLLGSMELPGAEVLILEKYPSPCLWGGKKINYR